MKTNFTQLNHINLHQPSFQANKKFKETIEAQKEEIEINYENYLLNLYELAEKNNMPLSEVHRQIRNAQLHRNIELGKLDILG